jgi:VanZ family protein
MVAEADATRPTRYRWAMQERGSTGWHAPAATRLGAWILVICWALILMVLAVQPGAEEVGRNRFRLDLSSLGHAAAFGALAYLVMHALRLHRSIQRAGWWCLVLTTVWGIAIEIAQASVPLRSPSMADLVANVAGTLGGIVAFGALAAWQSGASLGLSLRAGIPARSGTHDRPTPEGPRLAPHDW